MPCVPEARRNRHSSCHIRMAAQEVGLTFGGNFPGDPGCGRFCIGCHVIPSNTLQRMLHLATVDGLGNRIHRLGWGFFATGRSGTLFGRASALGTKSLCWEQEGLCGDAAKSVSLTSPGRLHVWTGVVAGVGGLQRVEHMCAGKDPRAWPAHKVTTSAQPANGFCNMHFGRGTRCRFWTQPEHL